MKKLNVLNLNKIASVEGTDKHNKRIYNSEKKIVILNTFFIPSKQI